VTGIDFDLHQGDFQKGHELPLAPKVTANAGLGRNFHVGTGLLGLHTDLRYQSRSKVKYSPQVPIDEYDPRFEVNARATYGFGAQQQYEVAVFGDNLTSAPSTAWRSRTCAASPARSTASPMTASRGGDCRPE
jgi:hypothetical protein